MDATVSGSVEEIKLQCVVGYTDGTYSLEFDSFSSSSGGIVVWLDSGKTISYIDTEVHVYDNNGYAGTVSDTYYY